MSDKVFPKVLLLGEPFNDYTGMGVTLTNLLKDWPKENIAVASYNLDVELCEKIRPCSQYVVLGTPMRHGVSAQKVRPCGVKAKIRSFAQRWYNLIGVSDLKHIPVDNSIIECIKSFHPDIIISALGSLDRIRFCREVKEFAPKSKLALYVVDDWPTTRFVGRIAEGLWSRIYDKNFRDIIHRADVCMSICQGMSDAYEKRYGVKFYPFHNPINVEAWDIVESKKQQTEFWTIVYVGKINRETEGPLQDLASIIDALNREGGNIIFDIYTPNVNNGELLRKYQGCRVNGQVPNENVPSLLKQYDALFLTLGFSEISRRYALLSMPTKLTEYLVSGVPTLLYCPAELALSKYVTMYDLAVVCNQPSREALQESLQVLINDEERCKTVVRNARQQAMRHDIKIVRERFRKVLADTVFQNR